jgi:hypothetical protein
VNLHFGCQAALNKLSRAWEADNAANAPSSEANPTRCYIAGLFCERSESGSGRPFRPRHRPGTTPRAEAKRKGTDLGVPFWFDYLVQDSTKVAAIERGWMNQAILADGEMPPSNKVHSPL